MDTTHSLKSVVREKVFDFTGDFVSFTSLDVSNTVKSDGHPFRHREVAAEVRDLWRDNAFDLSDYVRTPIVVTLQNGQSATAYLYHHERVDPNDYINRSQSATVVPCSNIQRSASESIEQTSDRPSLTDVVSEGQSTRRSLSDVVSGARKSIFEVVNRVKSDVEVLVSRHGPRVVEARAEATPNTQVVAPVVQQREFLDQTTRRQKADCRLEIPPTWLNSLGWESGDVIAAVKVGDDIELKETFNVENDDVCGLMTITPDGRLRITKTAFNKSGISHGPSYEFSLGLLSNSIVVR